MASAQGLQVSLSPSNHNGYHISCFGLKDGAIDATVTGGTPPYTYSWSNGSVGEDLTDVPAGYYKLMVADALGNDATAEITLVEPTALKLSLSAATYPNGHNISCHECYNGAIDAAAQHGVAPYSFAWDDGPLSEDRSGLGAGKYAVKVTDANGCEQQSETVYLTQPERSDWTMQGNAGTDPAQHYIGSSDAQDVVFKSSGAERLRLLSDGRIKLEGQQAIGKGFLFIDAQGFLRGGPYPYLDPLPQGPCFAWDHFPYWETRGNTFQDPLCEPPVLGTLSNHALRIHTNGSERMVITAQGKVGIGTEPPGGAIAGYRLYVEDGIATRDVLVKTGAWPDHVLSEGYSLMPLSELRAFVRRHSHLPGIPSAREVEEKGGVELGDLQRRLLEVVEQQALYILQLEERLQRAEQRIGTLEASKP